MPVRATTIAKMDMTENGPTPVYGGEKKKTSHAYGAGVDGQKLITAWDCGKGKGTDGSKGRWRVGTNVPEAQESHLDGWILGQNNLDGCMKRGSGR